MFLNRLIQAINKKKTALVVGLDPDIEKLPVFLLKGNILQTRSALAQCVEIYIKRVIELISDQVAVVKFQSACYECLGGDGVLVLERLLQYATDSGLVVILDGKRGDVPSTARFYVEAYLGKNSTETSLVPDQFPAFQCDALTVHPYLGMDSLAPFFDAAELHHKGVFVCVKTSNPGSGAFQDLKLSRSDSLEKEYASKDSPITQPNDTHFLYEHVARLLGDAISKFKTGDTSIKQVANSNSLTENACKSFYEGYSPIGIVVGATFPEQGRRLRQLLPQSCFLIPGWGHQGANSEHFASFLGEAVGSHFRGVLFNVSRGILASAQNSDSLAAFQSNKESSKLVSHDYWKARTNTHKKWEEMIHGQIRYYKASLDKVFN